MALVFKKIAEYDWQVTVQTPDKGKFKQETFTAKFRNIGRKAFAKLVDDENDEDFVKTVLVGWSGIKDDDGNDVEYNDDNFSALTDNHFIVKGIIEAFGESMRGASEKN
jgi:hypothetical protein